MNSTTRNYVLSEIEKVTGLIERAQRELAENARVVESKNKAITQWESLLVSLQDDLSKLDG